MSYIKFDNGLEIRCEETVTPDADGVIRMPNATILANGRQYVARDVCIDVANNSFSYPDANGGRTTWKMQVG